MVWTRTAVALLALAAVVSAGEFSATITTDLGGKSQSYPIYVKGKTYCMVQKEGGQEFRIVVDMAKNVTRVIVAAEKAYLEIPTDGMRSKANDPIQAVLHIPKELVFRDAGKETIGKYECEKREYTLNDQVYQTVWFSSELGLPLRIEQKQGGGRTFTMTEIKPGPVDAALFAVPEGFKKLDRPPGAEPEPKPEEKPKPMIEGVAYGRAPWGGRLAQGAEARIHFDDNSEFAVRVHNEGSKGQVLATVTFFQNGKRAGTAKRIELKGFGSKEVEKRFNIQANEARVTIDEGVGFVTSRQSEKMGADRLHKSYMRKAHSRTLMLKPDQYTRIVLMGDCLDESVSTVDIKLAVQDGEPIQHQVPLKNGEYWRLTITPEEKISSVEAHLKHGAVRYTLMQGATAKPLPAYSPEDKRASMNVVGAINYDDVEWMEQALADGLPSDFQSSRNTPMITLVAQKASPEMLSLLLEHGVDVVKVEKGGISLLGAAARNPRYWRENMELLLSKGADVNFKNKWGFTPLHYAVTYAGGGKPEVIGSAQWLLEKGADVNAPLRKGDTPLMKAVDGNDLALVELLLKHGADVNAKGRKGRTPLSRAEEIGNKEILEALKNAPAKE